MDFGENTETHKINSPQIFVETSARDRSVNVLQLFGKPFL